MYKVIEHHFDGFWHYSIQPAIEKALSEMDESFKVQCNVSVKEAQSYKKLLEQIYKEKREWLKKQYLPTEKEPLLDMHKLSAIICRSILQCKPIIFDTEASVDCLENYSKEKDAEEFLSDGTRKRIEWVVNNIYVNYKIAFRASVGLNYIELYYNYYKDYKNSCDGDESKKDLREKTKAKIDLLEQNGDLFYYEKQPNHENFRNSMILALAKREALGRDFDYLSYATIMFQLQMWTRDVIEKKLLEQN